MKKLKQTTKNRNESGVPLGGIGAGKIEFCADGRFTNIVTNNNLDAPIFDGTARTPPMLRIKEGFDGSVYENAYRRRVLNSDEGVPGAWLAVHTPITGGRVLKTKSRPVFSTMDPKDIEYKGRFPRAKVSYHNLSGIRLKLDTMSTFDLADKSQGYRNSALPLALFIFQIESVHSVDLPVTLAFSWQNLNGIGGYAGTPINEPDPTPPVFRQEAFGPGLWFNHDEDSKTDLRVLGDYSLRAWSMDPEAVISYNAGWNPSRDGQDVWDIFQQSGTLGNIQSTGTGGALALQVNLKPSARSEIVFALAWNMPHLLAAELRWDHLVRPSSAPPEPTTPNRRDYGHAYNNWFKDSWEVAEYGLKEWRTIQERVDRWHGELINSSLPPQVALALSNDLFPFVTNTWYTREGLYAMNEAPTDMNGCFGTLDQRGPGNAAIAGLFPELNKTELSLFAKDQIREENDPRRFGTHWDLRTGRFDLTLDRAGAILHDIGWDHLEGGRTGDVLWLSAHWPELTSSFILQSYQHALWSGDQTWIDSLYPNIQAALRFQSRLDQDEDGVPDLWGSGCCTYDTELYPYFGAGSYVTGLYLAALKVGEKLAMERDDKIFAKWTREKFLRAQAVFEDELWSEELGYYISWRDKFAHVWTGEFTHAEKSNACQISQLAGSFWADILFLGDIIDPERRLRALQSIYANNVAPVAGCPADESTPDGKYMQSMAPVSMAYYNAQAIYAGLPNQGWEAVEKVYRARYELDGCPWDAPLQWSGEGNLEPQWGRWYMSHPSSWYLLLALGGIRVDRLKGRLLVAPNWPSNWSDNLTLPVYLPDFMAELNAHRGQANWSVRFRLKRTPNQPIILNSILSHLPQGLDHARVRAEFTGIGNVPVRVEDTGEVWLDEQLRLERINDGFSIYIE